MVDYIESKQEAMDKGADCTKCPLYRRGRYVPTKKGDNGIVIIK